MKMVNSWHKPTLSFSGEPDEEVHTKRPVVLPPINLAGGTAPAAPTAAPQCWGYKVGGGSDADPELPCPTNP